MPEARSSVPDRPGALSWRWVAAFFFLTFALAWGLVGLLILFPGWVAAHFGEISGHHPLFVLAVYAPALSAITLVLVQSGPRGLARFLGRFRLWRGPWMWWVFLLAGIPAVFLAGAFMKGTLPDWTIPYASLPAALGGLLLAGMIGPVEEIGWRGFALPLLQRVLPPLPAALLLGAVWGLWHLPAFYLGGTPQSAWDFMPFFTGTICISVVLTPMFNRMRGSLLWPFLFHWQFNNPFWPDAQPYDTWLMVLIAIIVTIANWPEMTSRQNAVHSIY